METDLTSQMKAEFCETVDKEINSLAQRMMIIIEDELTALKQDYGDELAAQQKRTEVKFEEHMRKIQRLEAKNADPQQARLMHMKREQEKKEKSQKDISSPTKLNTMSGSLKSLSKSR